MRCSHALLLALLAMGVLAACDQNAAIPLAADARVDRADGRRPSPRGWALRVGGEGHDEANVVLYDRKRDELVLTGRFEGTAIFDQRSITTRDREGLFVARLRTSGELLWIVPIRAAFSPWFAGPKVALDSTGNALVALGGVGERLEVGSQSVPLTGPCDLVVVKISPAGQLVWARARGGPASTPPQGLHYAHGISVDATGAATVAGTFAGTFELGGGNTLVAEGGGDVFVVRIAPDGETIWAKRGGGPGDDWCFAVATDSAGVSTMSGMLSKGDATLGGCSVRVSMERLLAVARFDANGQCTWARSAHGRAFASEIALDGQGHAYLAGALIDSYLPMVIKISSSGAFEWDRVAEGGGGATNDQTVGIFVDGNIVRVGGFFSGARTFGGQRLTANGEADLFHASLSASTGEILEIEQYGGPGNDRCISITKDEEGSLYLAGFFSQSIELGGTTLASKGDTDIFIWKIPAPEP